MNKGVEYNKSIALCIPEIKGNEWNYVKKCLDSGWVSSVGSFVNRLEKEFAKYIGAKYAVATVSGTAALHIAILVGGIKPEDEVLVSNLSFIAPANAIRYANAWPIFIDAEPEYWQMDTKKVNDFLSKECSIVKGELRNKLTGRKVTGILPVHILGHPVKMDPIIEVARKYNLVVIEDASEGLGSAYNGKKVGQLGDIACFSFNGNKIITCGGGGMIVTDNKVWAREAKYLTTQAKDDRVEFIHNEIGYNYRLTNIQAAMGCAQLEKLEQYVGEKRRIAETYSLGLKDIEGILTYKEAPWALSNFWLTGILVNEKKYGLNSRELMMKLREKKIETRPLWCPINRNYPHSNSFTYFDEVTDLLNREALCLPSSVGLTKNDQIRVIESIEKFGKTKY